MISVRAEDGQVVLQFVDEIDRVSIYMSTQETLDLIRDLMNSAIEAGVQG